MPPATLPSWLGALKLIPCSRCEHQGGDDGVEARTLPP